MKPSDSLERRSKLRHYEVQDRPEKSFKELEEQYIPLVKHNKPYYLYIEYGIQFGEACVAAFLQRNKCRHILRPKCHTYMNSRNLYIIPQYNAYCRHTLRPFVKTVMRQLFQVKRQLQSQSFI